MQEAVGSREIRTRLRMVPQNDRRVVEGFRSVQAGKLPVDTGGQDGARDSVAMPAPDQASVQVAQAQQAQH